MTKLEEKLIDEINGHKFSYDYDDFRKGYNSGLNVAIETINQYNIITAPKSIKLSEIVERLNKNIIEGSTISLRRHDNEIDVWEYYKISDDEEETNSSTFIFKIDSNSIIKMIARDDRIPKWLYTLWIAGTIIEDDLEECDE